MSEAGWPSHLASLISLRWSFAALLLAAACVTPPVPPGPAPAAPAEQPAPSVLAPDELMPAPAGPAHPPPLDREFRAAWVATVGNIDWPSRPGLTSEQQQSELVAIFDRAAALNLNAVIFQVRPASDAFYDSELEPWSEWLTGEMGRAPSPYYDPLRFAIDEAHSRGLELHAWFNPFRARAASTRPSVGLHVSHRMPESVRPYGRMQWLDPGDGAVQAHVLRVIADVVRRYDLDGVHIDDYFYPYRERDRRGRLIDFPDQSTYRRYVRGGGSRERDDWRRDNVNRFVEQLYSTVKREKPWVKVGISPFGIWRPGYPAGVAGLDAYREIYADARLWVNEGWLDYVTPQLYWRASAPGQPYDRLLEWWVQENSHARHVWPGNYTSQVGSPRAQWHAGEILEQIRLTRAAPGALGNVHFSMRALMENRGGLSDSLAAGPYAHAALVPPSNWLGALVPAGPSLRVGADAEGTWLGITPGDDSAVRFWMVNLRIGGAWHLLPLSGDRRRVTLAPGTDRAVVYALSRTGVEGVWSTADIPRSVGGTAGASP
ncbi:MAG TPA: family 10 glycosylhydrolase [Gemmatimonadaceae bacterium]|nr:family 10 glycosylhydrolase [Gemmatimonadaceae bacterium]